VLSDRDQKLLLLRHGSFSANVEPQPTNSPMVVQTPSAEIQVLGTQFNVTAGTTETELKVNEGRVNFLRLIDGKVLEVPAEHLAIASLDAAENFTAQRPGAHPTIWRIRLSSDADVKHGYWKPALFELASKLKQSVATGELTEAEALNEYKKSANMNNEGSVWAEPSKTGCLVWLDVRDEQRRRILLTDQTRIRVAGRLFGSTELEMGFSAYAVNGGFAGKYSQSVAVQDFKRSAEGKFECVINVGDLLPQSDEKPIDLLIHDWWCVTDSNTAKLEITRIEILDK
ncbi:MAG: FecR family protein, partial [Fuerstiella sp.]